MVQEDAHSFPRVPAKTMMAYFGLKSRSHFDATCGFRTTNYDAVTGSERRRVSTMVWTCSAPPKGFIVQAHHCAHAFVCLRSTSNS